MKSKTLLINIRFGSWHIQSRCSGGLSLYKNAGHTYTKEWWPPKFTKGEFRRKPDWRWFEIYRLIK